MYSYEASIDQICKNDQIRAWNKTTGEYLEGHGYWDDNGGVYLGVEIRGTRRVKKREDIVLDPNEWSIYVMVPFKSQKVEQNVTFRI